MFHAMSECIVEYATQNNILDKNKTEEYIYGIEISLSVCISYLSVIIIGIGMGMMWEALLFLIFFVLIRRFAGGFHFSKQIVCYISTCIISMMALSLIKFIGGNVIIYCIMMLVSSIILLVFSPVSAIEKPLDQKEICIYGRITKVMIFAINMIFVVLYLTEKIYIIKIIAVTICTVAILLILGKIKYIRNKRQ